MKDAEALLPGKTQPIGMKKRDGTTLAVRPLRPQPWPLPQPQLNPKPPYPSPSPSLTPSPSSSPSPSPGPSPISCPSPGPGPSPSPSPGPRSLMRPPPALRAQALGADDGSRVPSVLHTASRLAQQMPLPGRPAGT